MASGVMEELFQHSTDIVSESVLITIIAKFLNCLPDFICLFDFEGNIICANESFLSNFTDQHKESFYPYYLDNQSKTLLLNNLHLVKTNQLSINNMVLKHKWSKQHVQWSLKSAAEVGLSHLVICSGHEENSFSFVQYFNKNTKATPRLHGKAAHSSLKTSPPMSIRDIDDVSLTRPVELDAVARLIDYGEEQMRKKIMHSSKKSAERSIRDAYREAEELSLLMEQKQTFVRSIAHEIRTPLNVVVSGLQLLDIELGPKSPVASTIEDMRLACEAAVDTIGDFLAYEKINDGILTADKRLTNFQASVSKCLRPFQLQAKSKGVDLRTAFDDSGGVALVDMDEYKMNQVVRNLVSNAIKFSSESSVVRVRVCRLKVSESRENVRLEVHDQGPGISKVRLGSVHLLV